VKTNDFSASQTAVRHEKDNSLVAWCAAGFENYIQLFCTKDGKTLLRNLRERFLNQVATIFSMRRTLAR